MWNLLSLVTRIWAIIAINFRVFGKEIINFVSSPKFLGSRENFSSWWSDQLLPFLWIVLLLSFVKQVFNYLFVSIDKQNILFKINLSWIIIWVLTAIFVIPRWNLLWWVITQVLLETIFTWWAIFIAAKRKVLPVLQKKVNFKLLWILALQLFIWIFVHKYMANKEFSYLLFFGIAVIYNWLIVFISISAIKKVAHGLTREENEIKNE